MANGGKPVTNADIFDRLDSLRKELARQIQDTSREHRTELADLRRQFESLEAGRLTRLEGKYTDLALDFNVYKRQSTDDGKVLSSKFVALGGIGIILLTALCSAFFLWLFKVGR